MIVNYMFSTRPYSMPKRGVAASAIFSLIFLLLLSIDAAGQSQDDSLAGSLLDRPFTLQEEDGPHPHGSGSLAMNIRGSRIYQVSYSHGAIGVYATEPNGTLSRIGYYRGDNDTLPEMSGATYGEFSLNEQVFFVTAFDSNALFVFNVNTTTSDLTLAQTYDDGELLDNTPLQLQGASDLQLHPTGQYLFVTAYHSNAWTVFRVNGSSLYEPDIYQSEATLGVNRLAVSSDGNRLFLSARKADALLVYPVGMEGEIGDPDIYRHNTTQEGLTQSLADASDLMLSSDGRYIYIFSDSENTASVYYIQATGALSLQNIYTLASSSMEFDADQFLPYGRFRLCSNPERRFMYIADMANNQLTVAHINQDGTLDFQQTYINDDFLQISGGGGMLLNRYGTELYLVGNNSVSMFTIIPPDISQNNSLALSECLKNIAQLDTMMSQTQIEIEKKQPNISAMQSELDQTNRDIAKLQYRTNELRKQTQEGIINEIDASLNNPIFLLSVASIIPPDSLQILTSELTQNIRGVIDLLSQITDPTIEDEQKQRLLAALQVKAEELAPLFNVLKQHDALAERLRLGDLLDIIDLMTEQREQYFNAEGVYKELEERLVIAKRDHQQAQSSLEQAQAQNRTEPANDETKRIEPVHWNAWKIAAVCIGSTGTIVLTAVIVILVNRHVFKQKARITGTSASGKVGHNPLYIQPGDLQ